MADAYEKRGYLLEDFLLFHLHEPPKGKIDYHYHEFCKLFFLLSGTGSYVVEGKRYLLKPGDVVRIGSHCIHRPEFAEGNSYERIILYISPAFLQAQSTGSCNLLDCFSEKEDYVLRPSPKDSSRLLALTDKLAQEISGESYGSQILSRSMLLRILVEINRLALKKDANLPEPVLPRDNRMLDLIQYLDCHFTEDLSVDLLAEQFYLSKYHLMRLFRRETGYSIHAYLSERRLLYARDLLADGVSATQACFRSGFSCYSSFSRAYSKLFGHAPTAKADAQVIPVLVE